MTKRLHTRKRLHPSTRRGPRQKRPHPNATADTPIWNEVLFAAEIVLLHASPVYYGLGAPSGDHSGVVLIPGFLMTDFYLTELYGWLDRIGYCPYFSGIGVNADCPNLLIQRSLNETIERALDETGRKIHLIGHSLGGVIARSIAGQRPRDIASVITLASPFRGAVTNEVILQIAELVRKQILVEHGAEVLPGCYTGLCTCNFIKSLIRPVPESMLQTAIYTRNDGMVDWRFCITDDPDLDFEVQGTHIGMAFNPLAYRIIAERLSEAIRSNDCAFERQA